MNSIVEVYPNVSTALNLMKEATVKSAFEVSETALYQFYRRTFNHRFEVLKDHWKWLYRSHLVDNKTPLIIEHEGEVIAHAGMLLQMFHIGDRDELAQWFVDFAVLDEWQRKGLGIALTNKWMTFTNCQITFCNYKSLGVFKKFGWQQGDYAFDHILPLFPGNQRNVVRKAPTSLRKLAAGIATPFLYQYSKLGAPTNSLVNQACTEISLKDFEAVPSVGIRHDAEFFRWRILQSPLREEHRIFEQKEGPMKAIVRLNVSKGLLSVLKINSLADHDKVIHWLASLANWGIEHGFLNLRFLTSDQALSDFIDSKLPGTIGESIFAYYSPVPETMELLRETAFEWQLIDSDFDLT